MARKSRYAPIAEPLLVDVDLALAGMYTRISVEDGDDETMNSLGNQKKIGIHYLSEHPDIRLVDTYSDNGYTGMNYNRPDFQRLMQDVRSGRINCIIVKDISRFGRHFLQTSEFVERILPEMGVRLICINDNYDSADPDSDRSALTLPLKMVMNDFYVKDIAKKIRSGINAKIEKGNYIPPAGSIPYGYIRNPELETFDVDPETAPIVLRIFQMRADGVSLNKIAGTLNKEGIPCPGRVRFDRGISKDKRFETACWIRGTIRKILSDQVYLGHRVHGRVKSDRYGGEKTRRNSDEWIIVKNAHPAIITQELYDKAQEASEETEDRRKSFKKNAAPSLDYKDIFRDKIVCAHCGSNMSPRKGTGRATSAVPVWIFYDCNNYHYSNKTRCSCHYVRQEAIMNSVRNLLNQQVMVAVDVDAMLTALKERPSTNVYVRQAQERYRSIVKQRKNQEQQIDQLLIDLTERLIDRGTYEYAKKRYENQLADILESEAQALEDVNAFASTVSASKQWINALYKYWEIPEITRDLVETLIDRIEIIDGKNIRVILRYSNPYAHVESLIQRMEGVRHAV